MAASSFQRSLLWLVVIASASSDFGLVRVCAQGQRSPAKSSVQPTSTDSGKLVNVAYSDPALSPFDRAYLNVAERLSHLLLDARGGDRYVSVRAPGDEIPLGLRGWERDRVLALLADSVPMESNLYTRRDLSVYWRLADLFRDADPLLRQATTSARWQQKGLTYRSRNACILPSESIKQAEYWRYRKAAAAAGERLETARNIGVGVPEAETDFARSQALWEQFGYRREVGAALAALYRNRDEWFEASDRHLSSELIFAIGESVPTGEYSPRYEEWADDAGWSKVDLRSESGDLVGSVSVRVVQIERRWLDWRVLRKGTWKWRDPAKGPLSRGLGAASTANSHSLMPLIPISLLLGRDLEVNEQLMGFRLTDNSRSHVRVLGVISRVVPPCP